MKSYTTTIKSSGLPNTKSNIKGANKMKINIKGVQAYLRKFQISYKSLGDLLGLEQSTMRKKIGGTRTLKDKEWSIIVKHYPSLRYYEKKE